MAMGMYTSIDGKLTFVEGLLLWLICCDIGLAVIMYGKRKRHAFVCSLA